MKQILSLTLLVGLPIFCMGQITTPSLLITRVQYEPRSKGIALTCQIINGDSAQTFYKANSRDYCTRLSFLQIRDAKTKKEVLYFPCTYVTDLDHIQLTAANTVLLQPRASYTFTQYLKAAHIRPSLAKGHTYLISFAFNHEYLCGGMDCQAFKGMLRSKPISIVIP